MCRKFQEREHLAKDKLDDMRLVSNFRLKWWFQKVCDLPYFKEERFLFEVIMGTIIQIPLILGALWLGDSILLMRLFQVDQWDTSWPSASRDGRPQPQPTDEYRFGHFHGVSSSQGPQLEPQPDPSAKGRLIPRLPHCPNSEDVRVGGQDHPAKRLRRSGLHCRTGPQVWTLTQLFSVSFL